MSNSIFHPITTSTYIYDRIMTYIRNHAIFEEIIPKLFVWENKTHHVVKDRIWSRYWYRYQNMDWLTCKEEKVYIKNRDYIIKKYNISWYCLYYLRLIDFLIITEYSFYKTFNFLFWKDTVRQNKKEIMWSILKSNTDLVISFVSAVSRGRKRYLIYIICLMCKFQILEDVCNLWKRLS